MRLADSGFLRKIFSFLLVCLFIIPVAYLIFLSFSNTSGLQGGFEQFSLANLSFNNFAKVLNNPQFEKAFFNSLLVSTLTTIFGIIINSMAGFALARMNFKYKRFWFLLVLISFMVPLETTVVALRDFVQAAGMADSYLGLILPMAGNGLCIYLFKSKFEDMDCIVYEQAQVDGASWWDIYSKVALPMAKGTCAAACMVLFLGQWNSLFWPLIASASGRFDTLQIFIASQVSLEKTFWGSMFAASVISCIPPAMLFFAVRKNFSLSLHDMLRSRNKRL